MKLNGWQRLWVVLSALWTGVVACMLALAVQEHDDGWIHWTPTLLAWIAPIASVYAIGAGVVWVRRGFAKDGR